jgi:4-hydroxy-tetrahydrodipicolinate reductase
MNKKYNIIQIGLGPMGQIIAKLIIERQNLNLKAVVDINPDLYEKSLSEILKIDSELTIKSDIDTVISKTNADVIFIATSSSFEKVVPLIQKALNAGTNVISICEELSFPFLQFPELSKEIDKLAKKNKLTVVGTGINPGYLMDLLPIVITAPCQEVNSLKVTRVMNSAKRREPFQRKIGTGLTEEEFKRRISEKEITGHVGLMESMQHIAAALGFKYDETKEFPPEAVITDHDFLTSYNETISAGLVCGLRSKSITKNQDKEIITLDFIAYAGDHEEYDEIIVKGKPTIHQKIIGGVHGDLGTSAMVVNLIPIVVDAKPGLLAMKDLPVPRNTERIFKF